MNKKTRLQFGLYKQPQNQDYLTNLFPKKIKKLYGFSNVFWMHTNVSLGKNGLIRLTDNKLRAFYA